MNIQIGEKHRITSDATNYTVEELSKPKKEGSEPRFYPVAYFTNIDHAFTYILERCIRLSEAENIEQLRMDVDKAKDAITDALRIASIV